MIYVDSLERALKNVKASMELSGFNISEEQENLVRARLEGKISEEQFLKYALDKAKEK